MKLSILSTGAVIPSQDDNWEAFLPAVLKRRTPLLWKSSHVAVARALEKSPVKPSALVCATALGTMGEAITFLTKVAEHGYGSARQFIATVNNSMAGRVALDFGISGASLMVNDSNNSLASAVVAATLLKDEVVLLLLVEQQINITNETAVMNDSQSGPHSGAIALVVSKKNIEGALKVSAKAPKPSSSRGESDERGFFESAYSLLKTSEDQEPCVINTYSDGTEASVEVTL